MLGWYWWEAKYTHDLYDMVRYWSMYTTLQALKVENKSNRAGDNFQCLQIRHQSDNAQHPDGTSRVTLKQLSMAKEKFNHACSMLKDTGVLMDTDSPDQATNAEHFFTVDVQAGGLFSRTKFRNFDNFQTFTRLVGEPRITQMEHVSISSR